MSLKLVKFKNFLGGAYSAPPNPPAVWARCARLVPPQNLPVPPQLPPQSWTPSYATALASLVKPGSHGCDSTLQMAAEFQKFKF